MKQRKVLLVDEDEESSRKTERVLRFRDWDVLRVRKLDEGLRALGKEAFDTVLVDLCGEEGLLIALSLKSRLRELGSLAAVAVISERFPAPRVYHRHGMMPDGKPQSDASYRT